MPALWAWSRQVACPRALRHLDQPTLPVVHTVIIETTVLKLLLTCRNTCNPSPRDPSPPAPLPAPSPVPPSVPESVPMGATRIVMHQIVAPAEVDALGICFGGQVRDIHCR